MPRTPAWPTLSLSEKPALLALASLGRRPVGATVARPEPRGKALGQSVVRSPAAPLRDDGTEKADDDAADSVLGMRRWPYATFVRGSRSDDVLPPSSWGPMLRSPVLVL